MRHRLKDDRRRFLRLAMSVTCYCERFSATRQPLLDIGLGGGRVYSEHPLEIGDEVDLKLFLPDDNAFLCQVRIMWVNVLENEDRYEIGFKFLDLPANHFLNLAYQIKRKSLR